MNDKEQEELGVSYAEIGHLKGRIAVLVDALDKAQNVVDMFLDNNIDWNDPLTRFAARQTTKKLQIEINDILEGEREFNQKREHRV